MKKKTLIAILKEATYYYPNMIRCEWIEKYLTVNSSWTSRGPIVKCQMALVLVPDYGHSLRTL